MMFLLGLALLLGSTTLARFLVGLAISLGFTWAVCRLTRALPGRTSRAVRLLAVPVIAVAVLAGAFRVPLETDQGTWRCGRCGVSREETRYFGFSVYPSAWDGVCVQEQAPQIKGRHAWKPVGCHQIGASTTACYFY